MSELSQAWTRLQYYIEHDIRILEIIKSSRTNEEKVLAIINEYKKED